MKNFLILLLLCPMASHADPKLPPTKNFGLFMQKAPQTVEKAKVPAAQPKVQPALKTPPPTVKAQPAPQPPPEVKPQTNTPPPVEKPKPAPAEKPQTNTPPPPAASLPLPEFFAAIRAGDTGAVSNFLSAGISSKTRENSSQGATALIVAVGARQAEIVHLLLAEGADVNASATVNKVRGLSPLMVAAQGGTLPIVKILTEAGADINAATGGASAGNTALMAAAYSGQTAILEFLIARGADVNVKNASGCNTLMISAQLGHLDALKILLKTPGIRIFDVDYHGNDALSLARKAGQKEAERIIYYTR